MPIQSLSHMTFIVRDLDKMTLFLCDGLGAEQVYCSGDQTFSLSRERFFMLGGLWLAAMEGEALAERSYNHVAFQIDASELEDYTHRLERIGVDIKPARPRVEGEGLSLYFYDFDNHLFELHTGTLTERLERYADGAG